MRVDVRRRYRRDHLLELLGAPIDVDCLEVVDELLPLLFEQPEPSAYKLVSSSMMGASLDEATRNLISPPDT